MLTHFTCLAARKMEFPDHDSTNYAAMFKSYAMSSRAVFQSSDEMRLRHSCLLIPMIWLWKTVLTTAKMELIEQFFSKMKHVKARCRSQLIDEHLASQLRLATTSVNAEYQL